MEFTGELEIHLTIYLGKTKTVAELQEWGRIYDLKCLHIILDRGEVSSQPMLTRRASGKLTDEIGTALHLKELLIADGFQVVRIKIEAAPWNENVPQSSAEIIISSTEKKYFENHIKILMDSQTEHTVLLEKVVRHAAHLSRNALRQSSEGFEERFVTQRNWSIGYSESRQKLNELLQEIRALNYPVIDVEEEYVIYDTNLKIDAGWIQAGE